jgi:flagellar hook-basal body complex protein FliE
MDVKFNQAANAYNKTASIKGIDDAVESLQQGADGAKPSGLQPNFNELVAESLDSARDAGYKGESVSAATLAGKAELYELVTAMTNAELTLSTVVAVRDRAVSAYQDIIKMPI